VSSTEQTHLYSLSRLPQDRLSNLSHLYRLSRLSCHVLDRPYKSCLLSWRSPMYFRVRDVEHISGRVGPHGTGNRVINTSASGGRGTRRRVAGLQPEPEVQWRHQTTGAIVRHLLGATGLSHRAEIRLEYVTHPSTSLCIPEMRLIQRMRSCTCVPSVTTFLLPYHRRFHHETASRKPSHQRLWCKLSSVVTYTQIGIV